MKNKYVDMAHKMHDMNARLSKDLNKLLPKGKEWDDEECECGGMSVELLEDDPHGHEDIIVLRCTKCGFWTTC